MGDGIEAGIEEGLEEEDIDDARLSGDPRAALVAVVRASVVAPLKPAVAAVASRSGLLRIEFGARNPCSDTSRHILVVVTFFKYSATARADRGTEHIASPTPESRVSGSPDQMCILRAK